MYIYVTVDAFIFFDTEPFDLRECWTIPSLAANLASHWAFLAAVLNTDKNGRSLGVIIATSMPLLQAVCACSCTSVCVLHFSLCFNTAESAKVLFELLWGQLRNRTRRENSIRMPSPPCRKSTHLLTLIPMIKSKDKCPTDIKDLTKTWLKPVRIFQSLGSTLFYRWLMFCKVWVQCFICAARPSMPSVKINWL